MPQPQTSHLAAQIPGRHPRVGPRLVGAPPNPALQQALDALVVQLERCEGDTVRLLGPQYIKRFAHWRRYRAEAGPLLTFIRDCLRRTSVTGWALHQKGGLSLEAIAIAMGPPLFSASDVDHARATLRLGAGAAAASNSTAPRRP